MRGIIPKNFFFDRAAVVAATDVANRKAMVKAGSFVRTRARSSMRRRKAASAPGTPPSVHSGELKNLLFFSYDPPSRSVVIGPVPFNRGTAPNVLEFGGSTIVFRRGRPITVNVQARPFMGPALMEETRLGNVVSAWSDTFGN